MPPLQKKKSCWKSKVRKWQPRDEKEGVLFFCFYCALRQWSWQHCLDYKTTSLYLGATSTAQRFGRKSSSSHGTHSTEKLQRVERVSVVASLRYLYKPPITPLHNVAALPCWEEATKRCNTWATNRPQDKDKTKAHNLVLQPQTDRSATSDSLGSFKVTCDIALVCCS